MTALRALLYQPDAPSPVESYYDEQEDLLDQWVTGSHPAAVRQRLTRQVHQEPVVSPSEHTSGVGGALEAIRRSHKILALGDDWDDEGSPRYLETTWLRATSLLLRLAKTARAHWGISLDVPLISPAQGGSLDLYWRTRVLSLLINVPESADEPATYYGERVEGDTICGQLVLASPRPDLIAWLTQPE
jgi:hypothetical protein